MSIEEILAALAAIIEQAGAEPLTDEQAREYEELETKLRSAQRDAQIRARQTAYQTPVPGRPVTATAPAGDDPLTRAFERWVRSGGKDEVELRAQSEAVPSEGGYLVPTSYRDKLVEAMSAFGGLADVVEVVSTSTGDNLEWPTVSDAGTAAITAEGAQMVTGADLVFGSANLGAYKYSTVGANSEPLRISVELLQDSRIDVKALVTRKFAERIQRKQAAHWATGSGVSEPLGILTTTADVELVTANTMYDAANGYAKLLEIEDALDSSYLANARWVMNRTVWSQIRRIVDTAGRPLVLENAQSGIGGKVERTLLGYPVVIDEGFPSPADDVNFLVFGDVREGYVIRRVADTTMLVDPYSRGKYGQVEMTGWARADGTIQNRASFVVLKGKDA